MNTRTIILDALLSVFQKGTYTNIAVSDALEKYTLSPDDKAFFTKTVYGTVQNKIYLEYLLSPYIKHRPKPWVASLLLMSAYQIVFLATPAYAAIDEAVEIANVKDKKIGGFVNAVLRAFSSHSTREIANVNDDERLSLTYSVPLWLVYYLRKDYPASTVEEIFREAQKPQQEGVRVNTLRMSVDEAKSALKEAGVVLSEDDFFPTGFYVDRDIMDLELFKDGSLTIQDLAAQKVAEIASPFPGMAVLDACAAPGGKSAHMAALMNNTGKIYACDVYPAKIRLMKKTFKRLSVKNVECEQIDARKLGSRLAPGQLDLVLCDAPCSGLGVLSHKVDLKYHVSLEAIHDIMALQKELLEALAPLVKAGGTLVYATCTLNKDENELQVASFLERHPEFTCQKELTLLPQDHHTDGAYIARLGRSDA